MSPSTRIVAELKALGMMVLYFACWLVPLLVIKNLLLEEYAIPVSRLSAALIGAFILSKVVLVLEHVPLGSWVERQPAWLDVVLRTFLYGTGVAVVLLLELAFEGRHKHGGFWSSLEAVFQHPDLNHVWINTICLAGALLSYNILAVIHRHLGKGSLLAMFSKPPPVKQGVA